MSYTLNNFAQSGAHAADAPKVWTYKTADGAATVAGADYFLNAHRELNVNDVLLLVTDTGTTAALTTAIVVTSSSSGVTIA